MRILETKQLAFFDSKIEGNDYLEFCSEISNNHILNPDEFGNAIKDWAKKTVTQNINIVALFSGAGGLDIGFCDTGFKLIESVEIEDKFVKTMLFNQSSGKYFSDAKIRCKDIRLYEPEFSAKIDFVIGGPPCQSFSAAGRRAAGVAGTKDERGNLFEEYVRILQKLKPKGFLFENVYGLLGAEKGESIKKIIKAFNHIGYNVSYRILDAADYGVPQHRERLIIVGSKGEIFRFPKPTHGPDTDTKFPHYSAQEAISGIKNVENDKSTGINGRFGHLLPEVPPGLNYSFFTDKMGHPNPIFAWRSKFSDFLYKADPVKPVRTLKASGGQYTGPFHWENRHFTIDELKRLQTFPDDYKILGNRAIASKQIGNSVPPQFARMLALSVLDQFFDVKLPFEIKYLSEKEKLSFRNLKMEKTDQYFSKAAHAIDNASIKIREEIIPKKFRVKLGDNFKLINTSKSETEIDFKPTKQRWQFELNLLASKHNTPAYVIHISRANKSPLFLEVNEILLISNSELLTDYSLLWKVLEQVLAENHIKADLVQLNGYYQYSNNISYAFNKLTGLPNNNVWKVIELILNDSRIGQIRNIKEMSLSYEMEPKELINCLFEIKKIGFEIRNSNTNPEILEHEFLIPYKFPTLTPLSVQLNKSL